MKYTLSLIFILFFILSCEDASELTNCKDVEVCTDEYRSIVLKINAGANKTLPDSTHTMNTKNGSIYSYNNHHNALEPNIFVVITDSKKTELEVNGTLLLFEGFHQNTKLFSEPYIVGHDCCHIVKKQGKIELNL